MTEGSYPGVETLGDNCQYWRIGMPNPGCHYPKAELTGRLSCEGMIDDVCLFIKDGRFAPSLSEDQMLEIKTRAPSLERNNLPPGRIS